MALEPFLATYTGGKFYPLGPDPDRVNIRDIAHSLSQQCRYAGHTSEFWSVAAHSLEVSRRVESYLLDGDPRQNMRRSLGPQFIRQHALTALLHDASEAYLVDIPKPIKPLLLLYAEFEANIEAAVANKYGTLFPMPQLVADVDHDMVRTEVANFYGPGSEAWARYGLDHTNAALEPVLVPLDPREGESQFIQRFVELGGVQ